MEQLEISSGRSSASNYVSNLTINSNGLGDLDDFNSSLKELVSPGLGEFKLPK